MKNSRLLTTALVLGLSVALFVAPACAWEFSMDGTFTWLYEYRGQTGSQGFFGEYDRAQNPSAPFFGTGGALQVAGAFAPYNFYTGGYHLGQVRTFAATAVPGGGLGAPESRGAAYGGQASSLAGGEQIVSGSDAAWQINYMSTNMEIRMNKAVRVRGNYFIGSWTAPNYSTSSGLMVSSGILEMDSPGVQRSFSPGYWRTLWLSAQLPWGELAVGKRPSSWGMGLQYDGADNRTSESVALSVPYGPLRIQISFYPNRRGYATDDYGSSVIYYNERPDKNNTRVFDITIPNVQYNSGPVSMGFLCNWIFRHRGGESVIVNPTAPASGNNPVPSIAGTRGIAARDYQDQYGGAFFKYNNGRFFLNSEYNYWRVTDLRDGNPFTSAYNWSALQVPPINIQHDSLAVEVGSLVGPAKISVIGAWFTGDDYRYSTTANGFQRVKITGGKQSDTWSNTSLFRPYSYLMIYGYGLGTSFARDTGNGFVQDASVYAARLDYAVAANLNIYSSFTWAEKFSKSGDIWGCLVPNPLPVAASATAGMGSVLYVTADRGPANMVPTIPDTALGYEIDAGFDWKLLEGLTARTTVGYWVPGKWFSYACVDKNIAGWGNPNAGSWGNNFYTSPDKNIDPVWGMEFKLEGNF
jgi:hypothetical protein